ncbi:MAG: exodeoxyribonuclease VII large subunit [Clostridia bacterium]|nr:exodeoxyribonuclease VII large subunit [Clostridia bacterium]
MESYISVGQLNNYIKAIFQAETMLQNIFVYGEISSYSISNGIAYFNLKDDSNLLPCVLFNAKSFDVPNIGDVVLLKGSMNYYQKGGKLSFNAVSIAPYGKGLLYEKFLKLKAELEARGYFDESIKKPLPARVNRIGVVTSATGAVIQDIRDVTFRRNNSVDIVLYPVKVQGVGAEYEIAKGIDFFSNYDKVDVVIVARGGGSIEDLEPFNTEVVANAVYKCNKPLVSAVGHETDFTICDFCSDLRAPTPSAAAELTVWDKSLEIDNIFAYVSLMSKCIDRLYSSKVDAFIDAYKDILDIMEDNVIDKVDDISSVVSKINVAIDTKLLKTTAKLDIMNNVITILNPKAIVDKGYSKIYRNGKVVKSVKDVGIDDNVSISLIDGMLDARVINKGK